MSGSVDRPIRDAAAGKLRHKMTPEQQPDRQRRIEPPGHQQHRPRADEAERRGLAGRHRDAVRLDAAEPRQRMHRGIAPSAAGAADGDHRVGFRIAERRLERDRVAR